MIFCSINALEVRNGRLLMKFINHPDNIIIVIYEILFRILHLKYTVQGPLVYCPFIIR